MKKICILGGAGYVGSVLVEEFLKAGHVVTVLDLLKRGSDGVIAHVNNSNFTLINADFMSPILGLALEDQDIVIHLAAIVGDPACAKEPELATKINIEGVKLVVDACNQMNIPLFFASTGSVYGSNEETCTEKTTLNPLSHYAHTKIEAENYIRNYSKTGVIFRFGTMHGISPNMRYDLVVNRLVRDAIKTSSFQIYDGSQYRPFLHPRDLARFFMLLFKKDLHNFIGEAFNLVSENLLMEELGELIERLIPIANKILRPEKEDDRSYKCSSFKAHLMLGFTPQVRVYNSIQEIERSFLKVKDEVRVKEKV